VKELGHRSLERGALVGREAEIHKADLLEASQVELVQFVAQLRSAVTRQLRDGLSESDAARKAGVLLTREVEILEADLFYITLTTFINEFSHSKTLTATLGNTSIS
jgi:hypothetical protein